MRPGPVMPCAAWRAPLAISSDHIIAVSISPMLGTSTQARDGINAIEEFKGEYRCIAADLRNAPSGQSTGPVEVDRPWESYADDQLGLMDHLGIDRFAVMGFCIGGPFIWSLLKRAPARIAAAVLAQPVGWRPEMRDPKYPGTFWKTWGPALTAKRPEIT